MLACMSPSPTSNSQAVRASASTNIRAGGPSKPSNSFAYQLPYLLPRSSVPFTSNLKLLFDQEFDALLSQFGYKPYHPNTTSPVFFTGQSFSVKVICGRTVRRQVLDSSIVAQVSCYSAKRIRLRHLACLTCSLLGMYFTFRTSKIPNLSRKNF
jgi:hypothetical protein